jgi:hypothetical protein
MDTDEQKSANSLYRDKEISRYKKEIEDAEKAAHAYFLDQETYEQKVVDLWEKIEKLSDNDKTKEILKEQIDGLNYGIDILKEKYKYKIAHINNSCDMIERLEATRRKW